MSGFDPAALLARPPLVTEQAYDERDTILYALGLGAQALPFVYEEGLQALPTMAVVLAYPGFIWRDPQYGADWTKILHGEQSTVIHSPLAPAGGVRGETQFEAIYDKGPDKGSLVIVTRRITDSASGALLATVRAGTFLRGNGGCGGSPGDPPAPHALPDSAPDGSVELATRPDQALLYRLSGDRNPLHVDPAVARSAGFDRPILHGLCTYGMAGRALVETLCGGDPARLRRIDCRFTAPVYPGEVLAMEWWQRQEGRVSFRVRAVERDRVVLNNGYAEVA